MKNLWGEYRKKGVTEMRRYVDGEDLSLLGISLSKTDTPEIGGMVARNPVNHNDQWYVAKKYFDTHYELVVK